ncbi:hypothetical protein ACSSV1_002424 [Labrenzia sp. MBR-25]
MASEFWEWLLSVLATTGVIGAVGYLFRDTVAKFFAKAVEHRFEKRLETFKGELRDNERELEQIRSFLVSVRSNHNSALQAKRLEAAESLLRARNALAQFSMLVEYMKILNTEEILKDADDPKVSEFIETLLKPFDVDEKIKQIGAIDKTLARLYLSEKSLKAFEAYESIVMSAVMMMNLLTVPLRNKGNLIKAGNLSKTVIELVPGSKDGFDKFGEGYAYHWTTYFYDQILKSLRYEISGVEDLAKATESITNLALDSRKAQLDVRSTLEGVGLPEKLIKTDESAAASSSEVEKARA